ncbi:nuclease-related domain-containing protein [Sphaerisporangium aureirubrum]|uniref:Nuclease-related domain-containing protein n=1 Tax=Sphaerisporangium aureirubrum TaxID=1544736 RepID=A0ABW1NSL4_9ACTN
MPNGSIYVPPDDKFKWGSPSVMYELRWRETRSERRRRRNIMAGAGFVVITALAIYRGFPLPLLIGVLGGFAVWGIDGFISWRMFEATAVWRGKRSGAVRTGRLLRRALGKHGYSVLDGRAVPGKASIDHLVIGPGGVWIVDNEAWPPDTHIAAYGGKLFLGERAGRKFAEALVGAAATMREVLSREASTPIEVSALLAVHGGRVKDGVVVAEGLTLFTPRRAAKWILANGNGDLTPEEVEFLTRTSARILRRLTV